MPRPRMPPTPLSSADISAKETSKTADMEGVFTLPPPAIQAAGDKPSVSRSYLQTTATGRSSPPASPKLSKNTSSLQRKRTLSGTNKSKPNVNSTSSAMQQTDTLPPPPTRARKIIQMKPKQSANASTDQSPHVAATTSTSSPKEATASSTPATKRKHAQPSASSAAGRKIARKTAHSIIERRRRSKMNEEFGVLRDMIPACAGVEMHKLAILQAGIEYVRYLEGCIEKLKGQNETSRSKKHPPHEEGSEDDECDECEEPMELDQDAQQVRYHNGPPASAVSESEVSSPSSAVRVHAPETQYSLPSFSQASVTTSATNSAYASPNLRPIQSSSSISNPLTSHTSRLQGSTSYQPHHQSVYSTAPPPLITQTSTPTGASPALGALHFSPDLSRTSTWSSINVHTTPSKPLSNVLPLPQAALPLVTATGNIRLGQSHGRLGQAGEASAGGDQAEATATAALLMMTKDRRSSVGVTSTSSSKGMSVRDLLSS